jgi:hypothetical protein
VREVECGKAHAAGNSRGAVAPFEPTGDHQMEDEEETLHFPHDALANPPKPGNAAPFGPIERRID